MNGNTGLKFGAANKTGGKFKRTSGHVDKTVKKPGLRLPMQNSETALGNSSVCPEDKFKIFTSAQEPPLAPLTSGQVSM